MAGLGAEAASVGKAAVEAGLESGQRFIPRAIMSGATFGTRTFIAETVKAFQDGGVNLEQFGKDVLKDTAFGSTLGIVGGMGGESATAAGRAAWHAASISSAGALGFLSSKMSGADNREASLNAAIWAAFETVGSAGKTADLRLEALGNLKESFGEYIGERNPEMRGKAAQQAASAFIDHTVAKAGFDSAEDLAKSGPENLLEGIEKVNQAVRTAKIQTPPPATGEPLAKLPAPMEPEAKAGEPKEPSKTPIQKAIEVAKGVLTPEVVSQEDVPAHLKPGSDDWVATNLAKMVKDYPGVLYEDPAKVAANMSAINGEKVDQDQIRAQQILLRDQISKMPQDQISDDKQDIYHFEQGKAQGAAMEKGLGEIAERFQVLGIKPNEGAAIFQAYGIDKKGSLGQAAPLTDLVNKPIEEQYQQAFQTLAIQRGLDPEKPNAQVQDHAEKAVDLINGYFNPKSQEVKAFVEQHPDASDHDIAQMAYNRGILESPNPDLLKAEVDKAKQENPVIHAQMVGGATMPSPSIPIPPATPKAEAEGTVEPKSLIRTYYEEIRNFFMPSMADQEGARILSASFSHAARQNDIAEFTMRAAKKYWAKQSHEDVVEFYDNLENGRAQPEKWNALGQILREAYDKDRADVQALGEGKLQEFNKDYAAHYWEKEGKTAKISQGRAPFEGSKGFLKERTFDTLKEGIAAGKIPLSWNPVDLFQMKHAEMQRFVASHKALQDAKKTGRTKFVRLGADVPENAMGERFVKINDPVGTVYKSPMVEVQEAYDTKILRELNAVGKSLGVNLERSTHTNEKGGLKGVLGFSKSSKAGEPGKIWTRFGGPESTLAHELGHQVDNIYGLQQKFLSDPKIDKELTALAHERREGEVSEKDKKYIESPPQKLAFMFEGYIQAPHLFKHKAPMAYKKLEAFLKSDPKLEPLTKIEPSLLKEINKSEIHAGGPVLVGNVYAEPAFARLFNNHLSKGLEQSAIFRGYRFLSNMINQFQLFGAFHANFMTGESMATELDVALRSAMEGNVGQALKSAARTPVAPVDLYRRATPVMNAWRNQPASPLDKRIADILELSGGRIRMDDVYSTIAVMQMKDFFSKGRVIRGILSAPFAALDQATMPILKLLVPHVKVGAFTRMMEMLLKNNPNMSNVEAARQGQKIWNTIEYRMGQMTYDNIFWNKMLKDSLHFAIRSVAWNLGTGILAILGIAGAKDLLKGKREGSGYYALSYWIASAMVTATANAMYQHLMTGKGPQEPMDYLYPKNGGINSNGKPSRSIPLQSYWPTLYNFADHPGTTAIDKMNAVLSMIGQDYNNKDFFGEKIRTPLDPGVAGVIKRLEEEANFYARTIQPFGVRNMIHNTNEKNASLENVVGPWVGDVHAPYWVDQTKAEAMAHDILADKQAVGGRTEEQIERSKLVNQLRQQYRQNDPQALDNIDKAYETGAISRNTMHDILINSNLTPLQRMVKKMSLEEAEQVYSRGNDQEKAQLELMMEEKRARHEREFIAQ